MLITHRPRYLTVVTVKRLGRAQGQSDGPRPSSRRSWSRLPISYVTSEDGRLGARSPGDGRCAGVVVARLGGGIPVRLITEFAEHPGAEDGPKSWQGSDHLCIRVLLKKDFELLGQPGDLSVHGGNDRHGGRDRRSNGGGHHRRALELRCPQGQLGLLGPLVCPTLTTARPNAVAILVRDTSVPSVGVGATFNTSKASPMRSSQAQAKSNASEASRNSERVRKRPGKRLWEDAGSASGR